MNIWLSIGTKVVVLALLAYSIAVISEQRKHRVTNLVLIFITAGIILDIVATVFMILGSPNSPFTLHGFIGYSALLAMLVDAVLLWRYRIGHGASKDVDRKLHLYSRYSYLWWLVAFISGSLIAVLK